MPNMTGPKISKKTAKLAGKVEMIAQEALAPGESVVIAVRVLTKGTVGGVAAAATGGAIGIIASSKMAESTGRAVEAAGFPSDPQQVLALTDRSLLFVNRSSLSGQPKELRWSVPLEEVADVRHEKGRMGDHLHLVLRSGAEISYTCVKVDPGAEFAQAAIDRIAAP